MQRLKHQTARAERWRDAFCDGTTGIRKTVEDLLWHHAAFRTTAQIVRLAAERQDRDTPLNHMLFHLIREGYRTHLILGTRRLLDKGGLNGDKGVYSIRSVVDDVKAFRSHATRKFYVEIVHAAEYDNQNAYKEMADLLAGAQGATWVSPELNRSPNAHRIFDELSGVAPQDRSPDDLISTAVFDNIKTRLVDLQHIAEHATTHIAHAGNAQSRTKKKLSDFDIPDAEKTLRQLTELTNLIGRYFANQDGADFPPSNGDQFEGLDQPLVTNAELEILEREWQTFEKEFRNWSSGICRS